MEPHADSGKQLPTPADSQAGAQRTLPLWFGQEIQALLPANGRFGDGISQYPDDFGAMSFNRVLALYQLNRKGEALSALQEARRDHAEMFKMLIHTSPRKPRLQEGMVTMGGRDEAWYYREDHLDLWKEFGALEWAQAFSGRTRPRGA